MIRTDETRSVAQRSGCFRVHFFLIKLSLYASLCSCAGFWATGRFAVGCDVLLANHGVVLVMVLFGFDFTALSGIWGAAPLAATCASTSLVQSKD